MEEYPRNRDVCVSSLAREQKKEGFFYKEKEVW